MDDVKSRMESVAGRLLDNERLTADLDDDAARLLLAWGLTWSQMIVEATAGLDEDEAGDFSRPRLKAVQRMMRRVNRWASRRPSMNAAADRVLLGKVYDQAAIAALPPGESGDERRERFLARAGALQGDPAELVRALRIETEIAVSLAPDEEE